MLKNVKAVKDRAELFRCTKWVPECISKYRKTAINAKVKAKSLEKVANVRLATARRSCRKKKLFKSKFRRVPRMAILLKLQDRAIRFLML